ncbi:TIGR04283 family arsenosugar biosynthesis glycosyltransferase [Chitinispirillales bacterium ANBcel5]|uniref:TIGR04283 family arsenosugar biosynthesis glycosyltransferase n=1 Tax=Cellulosispirillum alkaliphilum TaxID=3039283 RepID=UPI002A58F0D8|nr:TIGR04283 family arsenosugar biosynthesis glycosyltransferase [Chitinispirillales bacterium ANBcel5]
MDKCISVIIPTYNERNYINKCIHSVLSQKSADTEWEIIVSDGGSTDATLDVLCSCVHKLCAARGRARQLNAGAVEAKGEILFFLHAHNLLPQGAFDAISSTIYGEGYDGGGFSNRFSQENKRIKRAGRIINMELKDIDRDHKNISFCGDNGIFVKRGVFNTLEGFRDMPIMEDVDFSLRLGRSFRCKRITEPLIITSSRRLLQHGIWRTQLEWFLLMKLYRFGVSPHLLQKIYRRYQLQK